MRKERWVQVVPYHEQEIKEYGSGKNKKACRPLVRVDSKPPDAARAPEAPRKAQASVDRPEKSKDMSRRVNWKAGTLSGGGRTIRVTDPMGASVPTSDSQTGQRLPRGVQTQIHPKRDAQDGFEGKYLNNIQKEFPSKWFVGAKLARGKADPP